MLTTGTIATLGLPPSLSLCPVTLGCPQGPALLPSPSRLELHGSKFFNLNFWKGNEGGHLPLPTPPPVTFPLAIAWE